MFAFIELHSFAAVREKNVQENIDPKLLRQLKEMFENG
jgi:hypothetical protein